MMGYIWHGDLCGPWKHDGKALIELRGLISQQVDTKITERAIVDDLCSTKSEGVYCNLSIWGQFIMSFPCTIILSIRTTPKPNSNLIDL